VGFTFANASFVETVKSSQPITTTAVALFFGIDTLQKPEALAMAVIVVGVFCSTLGNAEDAADTDLKEKEDPAVASNASMTMGQALQTVAIAITANLCFALRVNSQKKFRAHPEGREMNDTNMLMWMQRMGSFALLIPIILFDLAGVIRRTRASAFWEGLIPFWALALINAMCFSLYTLTNTFVLTKVSVGQHTGLNALRRMFVIVFTAIFFGVPITPMKTFGVVLCFTGFSAFSYYRNRTIATAGVFDAPGGRKEYDPMTAPLLDSVHTKHQQ
jgi:drug/metabolite transporter (DMT)-like permease